MAGVGTAHLTDDVDRTVLSVRNLNVSYRLPAGTVQAVSDFSFDVRPGETVGLVGESGCGKSTTGRAVLRLEQLSGGEILFKGLPLTEQRPRELRRLRRKLQMVFQDPLSSLNPRRKLGDIVVEGLSIAGVDPQERKVVAERVLRDVGLDPARFRDLKPGQLSGGQAQRVAIARALAVEPDLIVCDEPVSALDVSVQANIINLIRDLKQKHHLTLIFISHDLSVVRLVSDRVIVMYMGRICETGDTDAVFNAPAHPYTQALLHSVPRTDAESGFSGPALQGDVPSPMDPPSGCRFRTRCPHSQDICSQVTPELRELDEGHFVACHFAGGAESDVRSEDR